MTPPKVIYVLGISYCGSSILNLLLNTQPGIVGLGEAHPLYFPRDREAKCYICRGKPCEFYAAWDRNAEDFYSFAARAHGVEVLADTSKQLRCYGKGGRALYYPVILSKTCLGFTSSYLSHKDGTPEGCARIYCDRYAEIFDAFPDAPVIPYRQMATKPSIVTHWIAARAGAVLGPIDGWDAPTNHVMNGNTAAFRQTQRTVSDEKFMANLGPKYEGRRGQIFYDGEGADQPELAEALRQAIATTGAPVAEIEARLGHGGLT